MFRSGEDQFFGETVIAALRLAAAERPTGAPLTTGRVLSALARVDMTNDWQRIWLHTGDPVLTDVANAPDPADAPLSRSWPQAVRDCPQWEGVPVSGCLACALTLLKRICARYRLVPAPSSAMALALLADPASGAMRALRRPGGISHEGILELIQSDLLDTILNGVGDLIAASNSMAGNGQAVTPPVPNPAVASLPPSDAAVHSVLAGTVPQRQRPTAAARRSVRGRLLCWRALSCLSLALTVMAISWHRQVTPSPAPAVVPPYKVPAVAHQMLSTAELPPTGTKDWLQLQDGPPDTPLFTGRRRFPAETSEHDLCQRVAAHMGDLRSSGRSTGGCLRGA